MAWFKSKQERLADNLCEERLYAMVADEIAQGQISAGLWAKALVEGRDEQRAKGVYIKLRVDQIKLGIGVNTELLELAGKLLAQIEADKMKCKYCGSTNRAYSQTGCVYYCQHCGHTCQT